MLIRMFFKVSAVLVIIAPGAQSQDVQRQAVITGRGAADGGGKCTVEVVVYGAAEAEVRGNTVRLRTLSGRPSQVRRFECTSPMPSNPGDLRFTGVDGRGRQELTRDPRNGGAAVVRIEDRDNGEEGYTFDLEWGSYAQGGGGRGVGGNGRDYPQGGGGGGMVGNGRDHQDRDYPEDRYRPGWRDSDYYRRNGHGFAVDEAVRVCQSAVARQAESRFRRADMHFRGTRLDDNPGRNDWIIGIIDVHRRGQSERHGFSCSVDFNTGRVRSARLD